MKKLIAAVVLSVSASASHAIGPEAVIGALVGGIIIGQAAQPTPYYVPPPVYVHPGHPEVSYHYGQSYYAPRPRRQCFSVPLYDAYGRFIQSTRRCEYVY
jgi:hypothetical protein